MDNRDLQAWDEDIQAWLDDKNFSAISSYSTKNIRTILLKWQESDYKGLEKNLSIGLSVLQFFKAGLKAMSEQSALLDIGILLGTIETFQRLLYERGQLNRDIARNVNQERHIKHLSKVIYALETHGSMTHTEMGEYLGLKPTTLSEAMKKILNTGFVQAISAGKFKFYSLTDTGIRYGRSIRNEKREMSFDDLILLLQDEIDLIPDEVTRLQINAQFESLLRRIGGMAVFPKDSLTLLPRANEILDDPVTMFTENFFESYERDGSKRKYIEVDIVSYEENIGRPRYNNANYVTIIERSASNNGF